MSRHPIVATTVAAALVLAVGCGGGKTVDTTSAKTLCPAVLEAQQRYRAALNGLRLQFDNKPLVARTLDSLDAFALRVRQLQRVDLPAQRTALAPLVVALSNQKKTFQALARHDFQTAAKYGNAINVPLRRGMAEVRKVCASPA